MDEKLLLEEQFQKSMDTFVYDLGATTEVAGYSALCLRFVAKDGVETLVEKGSSEVYDDLSFPLAGEIEFKNKRKYSYRFKEIAFNERSAPHKFTLAIPPGTLTSQWDFNSKPLSLKETKAMANFSFELPTKPKGLQLEKIIRQNGPVPAFMAIYNRRPYFLYVTIFKDFGLKTATSERGIKIVAGKNTGLLTPNPHVSTYSFSRAGAGYIFVGNISMDDLIAVAATVGPSGSPK